MMNTLDDCDLLQKVVNMTNVHEHNDFTVSIQCDISAIQEKINMERNISNT